MSDLLDELNRITQKHFAPVLARSILEPPVMLSLPPRSPVSKPTIRDRIREWLRRGAAAWHVIRYGDDGREMEW